MQEDDNYLRYVSVAGLITETDHKRVLIAQRSLDDEFCPGEIVFPNGRVEGYEDAVHRMILEMEEETDLSVYGRTNIKWIGECCFQRGDYPVTQFCFGIVASPASNLKPRSRDLINIRFVTPHEFEKTVPNEGYQANLHRFLREAQRIKFLPIIGRLVLF